MFRWLFRDIIDEQQDKIIDLSKRIYKLEVKEVLKIQKNEVYEPEVHEKHWYINFDGKILSDMWFGMDKDKGKLALGNVFSTKEEAEFELERRKVIVELNRFTCKYNEFLDVWRLSYDIRRKKLTFLRSDSIKDFGFYFESGEEGKKAIKEVGKDRIKKYLFEVE